MSREWDSRKQMKAVLQVNMFLPVETQAKIIKAALCDFWT